MLQDNQIIHPLDGIPENIEIPSRFTFPFHYTPHPLTLIAARQLQNYISSRKDWAEEIGKGKMFGVLIVKTHENELGFLAAFSGNLAGSNHQAYFVPPVYDMLHPNGFFKTEEHIISNINLEIKRIESNDEYRLAKEALNRAQQEAKEKLSAARLQFKEAKQRRDAIRQQNPDAQLKADLIRESQFQKAEIKRLESHLRTDIEDKSALVQTFITQIESLKEERKVRSATLQMKLFSQFIMLNAKGETKDLWEIFKDTRQGVPPAGAGECALPKLLQYAYSHQLQPLAMGEFWWGQSPKDEIRKQGQFYPSCKNKCEPILQHMLVGLKVDQNPLLEDRYRNAKLDIVFEDEWLLVVNKPEGMLSVPGKDGLNSVCEYMREKLPSATGPLIVHRLDMATSGLLLVAKTKEIHELLQQLFETRKVEKTYIALLDGELLTTEGIIKLPLCPDLNNRPRQMVSYEYGKPAVTLYKVLNRINGHTLVEFKPITGRTHQLRVHAAHPEGLNCPIVGDELYGTRSTRLMLHAAKLSFIHPVSGERVKIETPVPFL